MRIAILGAGNTGKAYSAYLMEKGYEVMLYDRSAQRLSGLREFGIEASGCVEGTFFPTVTACLKQAVENSQLILICTVAEGHRPVAQALRGLLQQNQDILIMNGCWGAVEFDQELGEEARKKRVSILETSGQLILCNSPSPVSVYLKTIKKKMPAACTCPENTAAVLNRLKVMFPQLETAPDVLYTSINNSNPITHGPLALFNITRMENGEDYLLFGTGVSRRVAQYMEEIDRERLSVAEACHLKAVSTLSTLNSVWSSEYTSLYDVYHNHPSYAVTKGPKTLRHRYFAEDICYGLVPFVRLARKAGVETPYLSAMIQALSLYMNTDYMLMGPQVEELCLSRYLSVGMD